MSKSHLGELVNNLYALLEPHDGETRSKAIRAVQVLFGEVVDCSASSQRPESSVGRDPQVRNRSNLDLAHNAAEYFEQKQPNSKLEELATAVRFVELTTRNESVTKSDIEDVFVASRRNFDTNNFRRDIDNAKAKGLFTKSRDKGVFTLSHFGQKYVDTLPNREGLSQLNKPRTVGRKKPNGKQVRKKVARKSAAMPTQENHATLRK